MEWLIIGICLRVPGSVILYCVSVVVSTSAWHAASQGFDSRTRHVSLYYISLFIIGLKTWLSTLDLLFINL